METIEMYFRAINHGIYFGFVAGGFVLGLITVAILSIVAISIMRGVASWFRWAIHGMLR